MLIDVFLEDVDEHRHQFGVRARSPIEGRRADWCTGRQPNTSVREADLAVVQRIHPSLFR